MTVFTESALKKQLQLIAKERKQTPAVVWQNVISDRFLVRLGKSKYKSNFILKGGNLLAKHINIGRETKDLDFSVEGFNKDLELISRALEEVTSIEVNDGFEFKNIKLEMLNHFHVNYPGIQVRVDASFGRAQFSLFIDLGLADPIKGQEKNISLLATAKGPVFEAEILLHCYPIEFVFAEKLETLIYRGADNTRMKDFHDLFSISVHNIIDKQEIHHSIHLIFQHRKTTLKLPIYFDKDALDILQKNWERYLSTTTNQTILPKKIDEIIAEINSCLVLA